jgi:hypothetical protein
VPGAGAACGAHCSGGGQQNRNSRDGKARLFPNTRIAAGPGRKLAIGTLAGFCSAFLPRLTAVLAVPDKNPAVEVLDPGYVTAGIAFAPLVGGVVAVLEWKVRRPPRDTFMTALGIPALIAGAWTNIQAVEQLDTQVTRAQAIEQALQQSANIGSLPASILKSLTPSPGVGSTGMGLLPGAHAAEAAPRIDGLQLALRVQEVQQYIVLAQAQSEGEAQQRLQQLSGQSGMPPLELMRAEDGRSSAFGEA